MKVELGSGERPTPGYYHQDVTGRPRCALDFLGDPWDIPLPPGGVEEVLAVGVMEHLRFAEFHRTLAFVHTLLAPGGRFVFDVPDLAVWAGYLVRHATGYGDKCPFSESQVIATLFGWQRWQGDEHKSGWTARTLAAAVEGAGFRYTINDDPIVMLERGLERRRFLRPDTDAHLYVEAVK